MWNSREKRRSWKLFWHSELNIVWKETESNSLNQLSRYLAFSNCCLIEKRLGFVMKWTSICRWRIDIDLLQGLGQEYWARLHGATRHSALWTHDWLKCIQKKSSPILCCHTDPDTFIHYSRSTIAFRCNFLQFDLHLLKSCVVDTDNLESSNQLRSYSLWKSWR
mgnify:CR=1 FL=1